MSVEETLAMQTLRRMLLWPRLALLGLRVGGYRVGGKTRELAKETVRRLKAQEGMSREEALNILGLKKEAAETEITRRTGELFGRAGSRYILDKVKMAGKIGLEETE